jgi:hypothetical protein
MKPSLCMVFCIVASTCLSTPVVAADAACAPLMKAVEKGMAQSRIHAASIVSRDGEKKKAPWMHSVLIGDVQYLIEGGNFHGRNAMQSKEFRALATNLAQFAIDEGCRALGKESIAGRSATVIGIGYDVSAGEAAGKFWIDTATGLPVRVVTTQPDEDTKFQFDAKTKQLKTETKLNGKTISQQHVYLYGDAVKEPGAKGAIDAATTATLEGLLK